MKAKTRGTEASHYDELVACLREITSQAHRPYEVLLDDNVGRRCRAVLAKCAAGRADPREDQPYFDISQIRRPDAVFGVLADAIRLLADALRAGRITPDHLAEQLLKVEGAARESAR